MIAYIHPSNPQLWLGLQQPGTHCSPWYFTSYYVVSCLRSYWQSLIIISHQYVKTSTVGGGGMPSYCSYWQWLGSFSQWSLFSNHCKRFVLPFVCHAHTSYDKIVYPEDIIIQRKKITSCLKRKHDVYQTNKRQVRIRYSQKSSISSSTM